MAQLNINLTKKQGELLQAFNNKKYIEILFGGGARGGKTWGICEIIVYTCVAYPGIAWLVGRNEWDDLRKTSLLTLLKVLNIHKLINRKHYSLNLVTKELFFWNESKIFFVPLKLSPSDPEFNFLGGYEITFAFVDEAQEVSRKAIDVIKGRFTEKIKEYNLVGKIIMGCNPDKGHLYRDFIKASLQEKKEKGRIFIQSLYKDNPFLDHKKYEESLQNADKITKERLLLGNWYYDNNPNKLFNTDDIYNMWTNPPAVDPEGKKYLSADISRLGNDRTPKMVWNGNHLLKCIIHTKRTTDQTASDIKELEARYTITRSREIIDVDGVGGGVVDQLPGSKGFYNGASPIQSEEVKWDETKKVNYINLKTQCYFKLKELMEKGLISIDPDAFDSENDKEMLINELENIIVINIDRDGKIQLEPKDKMKERIGRSPDLSDCLMMHMYHNLIPEEDTFTFTIL